MAELIQTLLIVSTLLHGCVYGDYVLMVRVTGYDNPLGLRRNDRCCDSRNLPCADSELCDNVFSFCLKPSSNGQNGVGSCDSNVEDTTEVNTDDADIDFSQSTFLGLDNPFSLTGISTAWEGAQLYIEVRDRDNNNDQLIDRWRLERTPTSLIVGNPLSDPVAYLGSRGLATITLQFQIVCAVNYYGPVCENLNECLSQNINCNQGQCVDGEGLGFCVCDSGYTGQFCNINIDDCVGQTCSGNGQCNDLVNSFECNCIPGFTGDLCEINIDDCDGQTCSGNGQCMDEVNGFYCDCTLGFTGDLCAVVDHCEGVTCSGNGACMNGADTYTCLCVSGYTGTDCETNIDDCVGVDCGTNRQCIDLVETFRCDCLSGFTGDLCETNIDDCVGVNCTNGQCVDGIDSYTCDCEPGYTGVFCDNIDDCMDVTCSGNGQCMDGEDSFVCVCESGFTGDLCSVQLQEQSSGDSGGAIAGGVVGGLLGVVLLAILIIVIVIIIKNRGSSKYHVTDHSVTLPGDNPVYGVCDTANHKTNGNAPEHEFDNPVYGDQQDITHNHTTNGDASFMHNHEFDNPVYGVADDIPPTDPPQPALYESVRQNEGAASPLYDTAEGTGVYSLVEAHQQTGDDIYDDVAEAQQGVQHTDDDMYDDVAPNTANQFH